MGVLPLKDVGLDHAIIVTDDGDYDRLVSFQQFPGRKIIRSLLDGLPPGWRVYADWNSYLLDIPIRIH